MQWPLVSKLNKLIRAAGKASILFALLLAGHAFAKERSYLLIGARTLGSEYSKASVTMDFLPDGQVFGNIVMWDKQEKIPLSGKNVSDGVVLLKIGGEINKTYRLQKSIRNEKIIWADEKRDIYIYRYLDGELSVASQTMAAEGCGPSYGAINVRKSPEYSDDEFLAELSTHPELKDVDAEVGQYDYFQMPELGGKTYKATLPEVLTKLLKLRGLSGSLWGEREMEPVGIEIGSEPYVIKVLRSMKSVNYANLAAAGCDGADRVFFVTKKENFFQDSDFSDDMFLSFLEEGIQKLYSSDEEKAAFRFYISKPRTRKLRVPPFTMSVTYQVVAASEVTRGSEGEWDSFRLVFEPFDTDTSRQGQYSVAVYAEGLVSSKRSFGNILPPGPEYFRGGNYRPDDEDTIAQVVQRYFAQSFGGVRCEHVSNSGAIAEGVEVRGLNPCGNPQ